MKDQLIGQYSPWGAIQHVTRYGDDIAFVSTSSHGGFRVTGESLGTLRALHSDWEPFLDQPRDIGWYEEDCDAPVVVLCLGGMFPSENLINSAVLARDAE